MRAPPALAASIDALDTGARALEQGTSTLSTGADIAFVDLALFVAVASFAFQTLVLGSLDLFGAAGMAVPIGLLVIGMGTAYLPTEFLPAFWQDWVYPWDPLRFMSDGFRGILYMGQGFLNASTQALAVVIVVGFALMVVCAIRAHASRKQSMQAATPLQ